MSDGILIIDKPAGITSHDVVARLRRILKTKKIGHTGTLDPFATGVLVMLVGRATRLAQFLDRDQKTYEAVVRFGFETDTGDLTGDPQTEVGPNAEKLDISLLESVLEGFRGEIEQTPPMYSAKKVKGKKLYELARQGIEIKREPVGVVISELRITNFELAETDLKSGTRDVEIKVSCTAGTYIRTLAEDIGRGVDVGAHLSALRRTRAGKFDISTAVTLEELQQIADENKLDDVLVSMNDAVAHLPEKKLSEVELNKIKTGQKVPGDLENKMGQNVRMTTIDGGLVAIGTYNPTEKHIQPRIVFQ